MTTIRTLRHLKLHTNFQFLCAFLRVETPATEHSIMGLAEEVL